MIESEKPNTNENDFLKSLNMLSESKPFDSFSIPRVAQLSQRSNQFNLRTERYTEEDIKRISLSDDYLTVSFTLEDKFGDNGYSNQPNGSDKCRLCFWFNSNANNRFNRPSISCRA